MAEQRCEETTMDSFFGNFLCQQKTPEGGLLRKLPIVTLKSIGLRPSVVMRRSLCR